MSKSKTKFVCHQSCGNSPRQEQLRDFSEQVSTGDLETAATYIDDDATWTLYEPAGQKVLEGKEAILEEYRNNLVIVPKRVELTTIVTHGKEGEVEGVITDKDGKTFVFCNVCNFTSASSKGILQSLTSYIIEKDV